RRGRVVMRHLCRYASHLAEMPPDRHRAAGDSDERAEQHAEKGQAPIEKGRLEPEILLDREHRDPRERQCEPTADDALREPLDEEGAPNEWVRRADDPHD